MTFCHAKIQKNHEISALGGLNVFKTVRFTASSSEKTRLGRDIDHTS